MKITCGDYWPRDESWWPHVPSEGNKSGDVSGTPRGGTGEVDIQVTSQWHGNRNSSRLQRVFIGESTSVNFCCMKGIKKQLLSKLNQHSSSQLSPRGRNESIKPPIHNADAPLHWCWIVGRLGSCMGLHTRPGSHILSILQMQTCTSPHMQRVDPIFWKRSVQIPCLVTPTCPGFHFPLPPLSVPCPVFIPMTTSHLAWETTPVALPRRHRNSLLSWPEWVYRSWVRWWVFVNFVARHAKMVHERERTQTCWSHDTQTSNFFFSAVPPFLTLKLGFLPSKSSNPSGEGLGRVLEIWLMEDSLQSRMKYFTLSDIVG